MLHPSYGWTSVSYLLSVGLITLVQIARYISCVVFFFQHSAGGLKITPSSQSASSDGRIYARAGLFVSISNSS